MLSRKYVSRWWLYLLQCTRQTIKCRIDQTFTDQSRLKCTHQGCQNVKYCIQRLTKSDCLLAVFLYLTVTILLCHSNYNTIIYTLYLALFSAHQTLQVFTNLWNSVIHTHGFEWPLYLINDGIQSVFCNSCDSFLTQKHMEKYNIKTRDRCYEVYVS